MGSDIDVVWKAMQELLTDHILVMVNDLSVEVKQQEKRLCDHGPSAFRQKVSAWAW